MSQATAPVGHAEPDTPTTCTDCGTKAEAGSLRWFPFTANVCPACAAKRDAKAEQEKRLGLVCMNCRKPYSLCVC